MMDMSPKPGFDTMRDLKSLEEEGLERSAAEAIVLFAEEATANLATGEEVAQAWKDLDTRIDGVEGRLSTKIDNVDKRINARINGVEEKLNTKIDGVEERLNSRIENTALRQTIQLGCMMIAAVLILGGFLGWMIDTRLSPQQEAVQLAEQ